MQPAVRVQGLGKQYRLGLTHARSLNETAARFTRRLRGMPPTTSTLGDEGKRSEGDFWALRDVDFEIQPGEVVGIIGRNGAGKSTLLKILSRVTKPTTGTVELRGRVGSLLEVGTGFHPELTGRENVYMNGTLLGMSKREVARRFDEIVDFAGVDQFIDTPVKRYSSGMRVRLGFAVAAHLEPAILIIDEVLAVGDAEFQKKCLDKMDDVATGGKTVLFVSHNLSAVRRICRLALLLERGRVSAYDEVDPVARRYLFTGAADASARWTNIGDEFDNPWFVPLSIAVTDGNGKPLEMPVNNDAELWFEIEARVDRLDPALTIGYAIYAEDGTLLYWSYQTDGDDKHWPQLPRGLAMLRGRIPSRMLNEGTYRLELIGGLHFREWLFKPGEHAPHLCLTIEGGLSESPLWTTRRPGLLAPVVEWKLVTRPSRTSRCI